MGSSIPQIPWERFSEESIHSLLDLFFKYNGYKTYNHHKIQRSTEEGADLIFKKGNKKIAIAVKIKPMKKDSFQLIELSRREEKEKWYIYFESPTPSFKKEMKKHKEIKYFEKKELNDLLYELNANLYVAFLLDNTSLVNSSLEVQYILAKIFEDCEKKVKTKKDRRSTSLDKDSLNILWRIKDDASSLHKVFRSQQILFETIETKEEDVEKNIEIVHGYLGFLRYFNKYCKNIGHLINQFYQKKKPLFKIVIERTRIRSNWLGIFCFTPFIPDFAKYLSDQRDEMMELADKLNRRVEKYKGLSNLEFPEEKYDKFNISLLLSTHSRIMANFFDEVECVIDDLFSYGVFDDEKTADWLVKKPSDKMQPFFSERGDYFSDEDIIL